MAIHHSYLILFVSPVVRLAVTPEITIQKPAIEGK